MSNATGRRPVPLDRPESPPTTLELLTSIRAACWTIAVTLLVSVGVAALVWVITWASRVGTAR